MPHKLLLTLLWILYELAVLFVTARADAGVYHEPRMVSVASSFAAADANELAETARRMWQWSPPGDHHRAVVQVVCERSGSSGSGVYFATDRVAGILTAEHVVSDGPPFRITWPDGQVSRSGKETSDKYGHDLAVVFLPKLRRDVRPLPITKRDTNGGERLEVVGYGGPGLDGRGKTMRHFYVTQSSAPRIHTNRATPGPMHGDSGGAIFAQTAEGVAVVSVVSAGEGHAIAQHLAGGEAKFYRTLIYPKPSRTVSFVNRVAETYGCGPGGCGPGGCGPGGCQPGGGYGQTPRGGGYELYPPEGFGEQEPNRPPAVPRINQPAPPQPRGSMAGPAVVAIALAASLAVGFRRRAFT